MTNRYCGSSVTGLWAKGKSDTWIEIYDESCGVIDETNFADVANRLIENYGFEAIELRYTNTQTMWKS